MYHIFLETWGDFQLNGTMVPWYHGVDSSDPYTRYLIPDTNIFPIFQISKVFQYYQIFVCCHVIYPMCAFAHSIYSTRSSGPYGPFLLAPAFFKSFFLAHSKNLNQNTKPYLNRFLSNDSKTVAQNCSTKANDWAIYIWNQLSELVIAFEVDVKNCQISETVHFLKCIFWLQNYLWPQFFLPHVKKRSKISYLGKKIASYI